MKKLRIERIQAPGSKGGVSLNLWSAHVYYEGDTDEYDWFLGESYHVAASLAQEYCDRRSAKAAEPKPPEGFAFSDKPGVVDQAGHALAWCPVGGFASFPPRGGLPGGERWLVPATARRETREEAEKRAAQCVPRLSYPECRAFMRGAGFEP